MTLDQFSAIAAPSCYRNSASLPVNKSVNKLIQLLEIIQQIIQLYISLLTLCSMLFIRYTNKIYFKQTLILHRVQSA